jgi:two-component system, NarL family, response regulator LiaR
MALAIPPLAHVLEAAPGPEVLTPAELRIVSLIARGWKPRQITALHNNSISTVKVHLANVYRKLEIHQRSDLILWCYRHGIR